MKPFQINKNNLDLDGFSPYIIHDMPIHPGFEIEEHLIESKNSVIYQQAENRMHVQKSLLFVGNFFISFMVTRNIFS